MAESSLDNLINYPDEERNLEFKQSTPWSNGRFRAKITKSILGMTNIRYGGTIIIGKVEQSDGTYESVGMSQNDFDSYVSDNMKDFVSDYADPFVTFSLKKRIIDGRRFVLIQIKEFEVQPVICKRGWSDIMHRGKIYTRSRGRRPQTIEVPTQTEMREIINMAVEKEIRSFYQRLSHVGIQIIPSRPADQESFDQQRVDLT